MGKSTDVALLAKDIDYIRKGMDEMKDLLGKSYVEKSDFQPVKNAVYGMITLLLVAMIGAIIRMALPSAR